MAHLGLRRHRDIGFENRLDGHPAAGDRHHRGLLGGRLGDLQGYLVVGAAGVGSAIFGFAPLIPYWLAASAVLGGGTVAQGVASHMVGNAPILLLLLLPSPRHWIQDQVRGR